MTVVISGTTGITSPSIATSGQKFTTAVFSVNAKTLEENTTIGSTENASVVGPIEVASGVTLTVTSGGTLAVI
jgi:hypothetical protein